MPSLRWPGGVGTGVIAALAIACTVGLLVATYPSVGLTADERTHVEAGLEWLDDGSYTISPENPPLARVAVALGLYLGGYRMHDPTGAVTGAQIKAIDSDHPTPLHLARLGTLPFLVAAGAFLYLIARRLFDRTTALVALLAWLVLPPVLAHAGLATTDMALVATLLGAVLAFLRWLERPGLATAAVLGAAFALALLTKFSAIVFVPCAVAMAILHRGLVPGLARRRALGLLVATVLALATVWAGYRFHTGTLASTNWDRGRVDYALAHCALTRPGGALHALARHSDDTTLPAPDLWVGVIDLCAHSTTGHRSYLFGEISNHGFPAYYLVALLAKTPLPLLAFALLGMLLLWRERHRQPRQLVPLVCLLAIVAGAVTSRVNIGIRHVLVVYPFLTMAAAHAALTWWRTRQRVRRGLVAVGGGLLLMAPVTAWPHQLAYFNLAFSRHADEVLLDSDLDWGQDLPGLERAAREHHIGQLSIAYFGTPDLCAHALPPMRWLVPGRPTAGWVAISEMYRHGVIQGHFHEDAPCDRDHYVFDTTRGNGYAWLDAFTPVEIIGGSIRLYYIPAVAPAALSAPPLPPGR